MQGCFLDIHRHGARLWTDSPSTDAYPQSTLLEAPKHETFQLKGDIDASLDRGLDRVPLGTGQTTGFKSSKMFLAFIWRVQFPIDCLAK